MRKASIQRSTKETTIEANLNLDGSGSVTTETGVGFFDHRIDAFGRHGLFDIELKAKGDLEVDSHHTVEDCGIVLGNACAQALGEKQGITRYGHAIVPMDETLVLAAIDISGRGNAFVEADIPAEQIGNFDTELAEEFFIAFAANAGITLHIKLLAGKNSHHIIEAAFKACARALRMAVSLDERVQGVPSTKGAL